MIILTLSGSQGKGVFLSDNKKSFVNLMHLIEGTNSTLNVILQEFIKDSYGKDLRVFTIGGRAIASMERKAAEGGFKANFSDGASVIPYVVSPEIAKLATEAARISGLDIAGVDLLFDGDHFKICEVNSSPGFEGLESCCNINIPQEVLNYIISKMGHMHERKKMLL